MKIFRFIRSACIIFAAFLFLQACGGKDPFSVDYSQVPPPYDISEAVRDTILPDGLKIYVIEEGDGPFAVTFKDRIVVKFTGRTASGKVFKSSYARRRDEDTNFKTRLYNLYPYPIRSPITGRVIPPLIEGFRKGLYGMEPGEKRVIVVPPEMGSRQIQNGINLEGKTLIYNVKLVQILGIPQDQQ